MRCPSPPSAAASPPPPSWSASCRARASSPPARCCSPASRSARFSTALMGLIAFASDDRELRDLTLWMLGSLSGASWPKVLAIAPFALLVVLVLPPADPRPQRPAARRGGGVPSRHRRGAYQAPDRRHHGGGRGCRRGRGRRGRASSASSSRTSCACSPAPTIASCCRRARCWGLAGADRGRRARAWRCAPPSCRSASSWPSSARRSSCTWSCGAGSVGV